MKKLHIILFVVTSTIFCIQQGVAQRTHTVKDIFLLLPDTAFTSMKELNFAQKDSFPITERDKMFDNFDAKKKTFTPKDPRFHITTINETNHLLNCINANEIHLNIKVWDLPNNEALIAIDANYKEDLVEQTVKFYSYKAGKITPAKPLQDAFAVSLFFETSYLQKQKVDPNFTVPNTVVVFSKSGDELLVKLQNEIFDEELFGAKGHPMTKLSPLKMVRPDVILNLVNYKFVIKK